jgi:hypothetical protein
MRLCGVHFRGCSHRYRVIAVYDNPTGQTLAKGAMGSLVGIFAPHSLAEWPRLKPRTRCSSGTCAFSRAGGMA